MNGAGERVTTTATRLPVGLEHVATFRPDTGSHGADGGFPPLADEADADEADADDGN